MDDLLAYDFEISCHVPEEFVVNGCYFFTA